MRLGLRPAIKHEGKIFVGDASDSHATAAERYGIPAPEESRGFSPNGKIFLTRQKALGWIKFNEPKLFSAVMKLVSPDGLHSEHYAKAKGLKQRVLTEATNAKVQTKSSATDNDITTKTAIVYDRGGLYLYCAEKLAEKYK